MLDVASSVPETKPRHVRGSRRVTLKRNPIVRPLGPEDLKYLGAAWRMGGLRDAGDPFDRPDMTAQEFLSVANAAMERLTADGAALWMLEAPVGGKATPVGFIAAARVEHRLEPHVYWFPWASARNRLETIVKFIHLARREFLVIVIHKAALKRFFEAVAAHGLLHRVGVIPGYYADDDGMIWRARRPGERKDG